LCSSTATWSQWRETSTSPSYDGSARLATVVIPLLRLTALRMARDDVGWAGAWHLHSLNPLALARPRCSQSKKSPHPATALTPLSRRLANRGLATRLAAFLRRCSLGHSRGLGFIGAVSGHVLENSARGGLGVSGSGWRCGAGAPCFAPASPSLRLAVAFGEHVSNPSRPGYEPLPNP
jgi:hypothetical protein